MRLNEIFLLLTDLLSGGLSAFQARLQSIQDSSDYESAYLTRYLRMDPHARWHIWAILSMVGVNYLVLVHVPTWLSYSANNQPVASYVVWNIEPEVWEGNLSSLQAETSLDMLGTEPASDPYTTDHSEQLFSAPVDVDPVPINLHQIRRRVQLPTEMLPEHGAIRVRVNVLVDEAGEYVAHRIPAHGLPELTKAVENHLPSLSFLPALRNGRPVSHWVEVSFVFDL